MSLDPRTEMKMEEGMVVERKIGAHDFAYVDEQLDCDELAKNPWPRNTNPVSKVSTSVELNTNDNFATCTEVLNDS